MSIEEQEVNQGKTEEEAFQEEMARLNNADVVEESPAKEAPVSETTNEESTETIAKDVDANDQGDDQASKAGEESKDELLQRIDKLQRALDRTNGTYGSQLQKLQNQIETLTKQRQDVTDHAKPVTVELSDDDFDELRQEFPELADKTASGVRKLIQRAMQNVVPASNQVSKEDVIDSIKPFLDENRQEIRKEIYREMLTDKHPDWNDIAGFNGSSGVIEWNNIAFGNWVSVQPVDVQEEIINGSNISKLAKHISDYKDSIKPKPKQQFNLHKSVQPRSIPGGSGGGSLDPEQEAFEAELRRLHSTP